MALIGIQSTNLKSVKTKARYCSGCSKNDTIILNIHRKQVCIFGIPLFPIGKTGNAFCQNCKTTLEEENMPEFIRHEYLILKNESKGPSWQLSGSLFLLGIAFALSLVNSNTNQPGLQYLTSPLKGDIYEYKIDKANYSTMKVIKVSSDSLYVVLNRQKIGNAYRIHQIERSENYSKNMVAFERQKINDMYNNSLIHKINRSN
ncbi:MAG: hypothetical protein AB8B59_06215 [Maribacter sp.]